MKTITILGTGPSFIHCSFGEDCGEVWGNNGTYTAARLPHLKDKFRLDKLFITDQLFRPDGTFCFDLDAINGLKEIYKTEIYSAHKLKLGSIELQSHPFPTRGIMKKMGSRFLNSTIDWMLAYALYKHTRLTKNKYGISILELTTPLTLKLYGIDMATQYEKDTNQRGGVEHWLGYARGLGCEVYVCEHSVLLRTATGLPYGQKLNINLRNVDPFNLLKRRRNGR